jgi:predicted nucleic acid-binding protein
VIFVDTNVLVDLLNDDPVWAQWSRRELANAKAQHELAISPVVYAELSVGYAHIEDVDLMLDTAGIVLMPIPRAALFLAGKAFRQYRAAGGIRTGVLPDFFIGAHALITDAPLVTRDPRRYRTYFPGLALIAPTHN